MVHAIDATGAASTTSQISCSLMFMEERVRRLENRALADGDHSADDHRPLCHSGHAEYVVSGVYADRHG
jgi:hypothetical protein